jgi:hypothetical protein
MTAQTQESQPQETKPNDKELNFRALEAKYQRELANERAAREQAERELAAKSQAALHEDEDDDEPYVDKKKLEKKLARFGETTMKQTQSEIQSAVHAALREERKQNWIKSNPDFYEVLQHADKFAQKDPELAETILEMPEGFERQKLVYKNIKALGIHKPEVKTPSIQEKIDSNRKGPYYQPTGVGSAPYTSQGDFSNNGQKQAYEKMQELKNRLRI